ATSRERAAARSRGWRAEIGQTGQIGQGRAENGSSVMLPPGETRDGAALRDKATGQQLLVILSGQWVEDSGMDRPAASRVRPPAAGRRPWHPCEKGLREAG